MLCFPWLNRSAGQSCTPWQRQLRGIHRCGEPSPAPAGLCPILIHSSRSPCCSHRIPPRSEILQGAPLEGLQSAGAAAAAAAPRRSRTPKQQESPGAAGVGGTIPGQLPAPLEPGATEGERPCCTFCAWIRSHSKHQVKGKYPKPAEHAHESPSCPFSCRGRAETGEPLGFPWSRELAAHGGSSLLDAAGFVYRTQEHLFP